MRSTQRPPKPSNSHRIRLIWKIWPSVSIRLALYWLPTYYQRLARRKCPTRASAKHLRGTIHFRTRMKPIIKPQRQESFSSGVLERLWLRRFGPDRHAVTCIVCDGGKTVLRLLPHTSITGALCEFLHRTFYRILFTPCRRSGFFSMSLCIMLRLFRGHCHISSHAKTVPVSVLTKPCFVTVTSSLKMRHQETTHTAWYSASSFGH